MVIFVLRTRRNPLRSRPHPLLATTSIAVVVLAVGSQSQCAICH
jgi:Mg2+-importing ATPase